MANKRGRHAAVQTVIDAPNTAAAIESAWNDAETEVTDTEALGDEVAGGTDVTDDDFQVEIAETLALLPPVSLTYVWSVPGDREGYALRLVSLAKSVDEARWDVIENAEERIGRTLSATEVNWVSTVEPEVVTPVSEISIDYNNALMQNARLKAENEELADTKLLFMSMGIDPVNPRAWVDSVNASAAKQIDDADAKRDERHKMACARFQRVLDELRGVQEEFGFAPPLPTLTPEPDYSALTVVYPDEHAMELRDVLFPRLSSANAVARNPVEPMGEQESAGYRLMQRVFDNWHFKGGGSENEHAEMRAFLGWIRSVVPVTSEGA